MQQSFNRPLYSSRTCLSKYPPLAFRVEPIREWPGDVGREDESPASDRKGVVGSLMEKSLGEGEAGEAPSPLASFS